VKTRLWKIYCVKASLFKYKNITSLLYCKKYKQKINTKFVQSASLYVSVYLILSFHEITQLSGNTIRLLRDDAVQRRRRRRNYNVAERHYSWVTLACMRPRTVFLSAKPWSQSLIRLDWTGWVELDRTLWSSLTLCKFVFA